jgi:hypothetical protein
MMPVTRARRSCRSVAPTLSGSNRIAEYTTRGRDPELRVPASPLRCGVRTLSCWAILLANLRGRYRLELEQIDVTTWELLADEADTRTVVLLLYDLFE